MERTPSATSYTDDIYAQWRHVRIPLLVVLAAVVLTTKVIGCIRNRRKRRSIVPRLEHLGVSASKARPSSDISGQSVYENGQPRTGDIPSTRLEEGLVKTAKQPRRVLGKKQIRKSSKRANDTSVEELCKIRLLVFYASITGSTQRYARSFFDQLATSLASTTSEKRSLTAHLIDLAEADYDHYFISVPRSSQSESLDKYLYLFLIPTYDIDTILNTFLAHLQETHYDFRIDTAPLRALLGYSVFGFGDREGWPTEEGSFCAQARELDKWMARLTGGRRAFPLGLGDVRSDAEHRLDEWRLGIENVARTIGMDGSLGEGVRGSGDALESDEEVEDGAASAAQARTQRSTEHSIDDVEEVGKAVQVATDRRLNSTAANSLLGPSIAPKEMVPKSSPTYAALTKQGYTIVGSHSGVKICRWTKSALRGRGSCYKYSFYGIKSHLCMETTPSLSCSNKCVFCWRHGTNPVGTVWRWQVDPPEMIFEGAKQGHYRKIRTMRGVPGVLAERFAEAFRIRHCALSLVGEPIFYPRINELLALLHRERISTFLVCNAQHPDQLERLDRVTQLYVSVDASNRDSLRRIDRPLHRDFWERFLRCLDILRRQRFRQRTVFRLTLVKGFNVEDEVQGYADLIMRALPCFVEIKGVTFCGSSSNAKSGENKGLTMSNVPFHAEVAQFASALDEALEERFRRAQYLSSKLSAEERSSMLDPVHESEGYGIAAEHSHSCCILLASKRFLLDGKWHTRIDYDRFFDLLSSEASSSSSSTENTGPSSCSNNSSNSNSSSLVTGAKDHSNGAKEPFRPEDYIGPATPDWALFGNGGFDPVDTRVWTRGRNKGKQAPAGILTVDAG